MTDIIRIKFTEEGGGRGREGRGKGKGRGTYWSDLKDAMKRGMMTRAVNRSSTQSP